MDFKSVFVSFAKRGFLNSRVFHCSLWGLFILSGEQVEMGLGEPSSYLAHTLQNWEQWVGMHDTGDKKNFLLWAMCSTSDIGDEEYNSLIAWLVAVTALAAA